MPISLKSEMESQSVVCRITKYSAEFKILAKSIALVICIPSPFKMEGMKLFFEVKKKKNGSAKP